MPKHRKVLLSILIPIAVIALLITFGYSYGSRHFVVTERTLTFDDLPAAFDGYRIAQISDFHAGAFHMGHDEDVEKIVNLVNAQKCDLIVFTGDLVTRQASELDGFTDILSRLQAPDGVYSVMGNHDYSLYMRHFTPAQHRADIRCLQQTEADMGWHLLLNDHDIIRRGADSIAIIGVENDGTPPHFPSYGNLPRATKGIAPGTFSVLLSHDPTHWLRSVQPDTDIQLTLSGHTHAGQFKLFGWSPVRHVYDHWTGVYTETKQTRDGRTVSQTLHISEGIGCVPFPYRIGAWPEVNVITLKKGMGL